MEELLLTLLHQGYRISFRPSPDHEQFLLTVKDSENHEAVRILTPYLQQGELYKHINQCVKEIINAQLT